MRCEFIRCRLTLWYLVLTEISPITTSTNHMNSNANLTTLPLLHVETHTSQLSRLEQVSGEYWTILIGWGDDHRCWGVNGLKRTSPSQALSYHFRAEIIMTLVTLFNCVCCFYAGQTLLIQPSCDLVVWINWFTFLFLMNQWVNLMHIIIYWLCQLGPVQTPNFSWAELNSTYGWSKLFRPAELIQMPILIAAEQRSKGAKCSFRSNCLQGML